MLTHHWYETQRIFVIRVSGEIRLADHMHVLTAIRRNMKYGEQPNWVLIAMDCREATLTAAIELAEKCLTVLSGPDTHGKCAVVVPGTAPQSLLRPLFRASDGGGILVKMFSSEASAMAWAGAEQSDADPNVLRR